MPTPFQKRLQRKRMLAEEFKHSGLTRVSYCRKKKIPLSTLDWWLQKIRRERHSVSSTPEQPLFIPLVTTSDSTMQQRQRFELYWADGRRLVLPAGIGIDDVVRLICATAAPA
jgi:hypothetical protein